MKSLLVSILVFASMATPLSASVEVPMSLDELAKQTISDIVVAEVLTIRRPPTTADWEFDLQVTAVIKGATPKKFTATVHYFSKPGVSIKSTRSGLESSMEVGKSYLFLFGAHAPDAQRINLVRAESLDKREAIVRRFAAVDRDN